MINTIKLEMSGCYIIYAMQLNEGKYYIGTIHTLYSIDDCYEEHVKGIVCEWTAVYSPICIIEQYNHFCKYEYIRFMKKYMMKYGIENVRGAYESYQKMKLDDYVYNQLVEEFKMIENEDNIYYENKNKDCQQNENKQTIDNTNDNNNNNNNNNNMFSKYLSYINDKEQLKAQIESVEDVILNAKKLQKCIHSFKYILNDTWHDQIEIEPSIIDTYNMRNLVWPCKMIDDRNFYAVKIYEYILELNKSNQNIFQIKDESMVVQNIYKCYIYRKALEKELLEILQWEMFAIYREDNTDIEEHNIENENNETSKHQIFNNNNVDELLTLIQTKNELLYKKWCELCEFI